MMVDFQRKSCPATRRVVFDDESGSADPNPNVLFASLTVAGRTRNITASCRRRQRGRLLRRDRQSAKKFPGAPAGGESEMRSRFGSRRHPILGYTRMHTGVDWATAAGTPIFRPATARSRRPDGKAATANT